MGNRRIVFKTGKAHPAIKVCDIPPRAATGGQLFPDPCVIEEQMLLGDQRQYCNVNDAPGKLDI